MILKEMVRSTARDFIEKNFRSDPKQILLNKSKFDKWIDLIHLRINGLNDYLFMRGHNLSKAQLERYIQHGVIFYAKEQLKELQKASEELSVKIDNTKG